MGYSKNAISGISWMTAFRITSRLIAFIKIIIIARILAPSELGVFGIATMALVLLEILTETGINVFLIQEKDDVDSYVNDAWLVSIVRGFLIGLLIMSTAPLIAVFFNIQHSLGIILLISVVPVIKGFINPSEVKFQKELKFSKEFYFRMSIFAFDSLVAIIISLITNSVIGLVFGLISGAILEVVLSFILIKPIPFMKFNMAKINKIIHSGKWVTLSGIFNYAASEGDNIAIGKFLGPGPLGIYQMGHSIATLPISEITDVANKVTFPVYSIMSDDMQRLKKGFIKIILFVSAFSIPLGIAIFLFPKDLFILIFSQKWEDTADVLKPLAIYGVIRGISGVTSSLFLSLSKQNYVAGITFLRFAVLLITIVPLTINIGILGAAYSVLISGVMELPAIGYCLWLVFRRKK